MSPLERKKLEVELHQVEGARRTMELKIMEREDEIERIKESIKIQETREKELQAKLAEG